MRTRNITIVALTLSTIALLGIVLLLLLSPETSQSHRPTPNVPSKSDQEQREVCLKLLDSYSQLTIENRLTFEIKEQRLRSAWDKSGCDAYFESLPPK